MIHPRDITEETEYAIDQFVLRGGKLIAFVDPYAYFDQQPDCRIRSAAAGRRSRRLTTLFKAWGVEPTLNKVVADLTYRERRRAARCCRPCSRSTARTRSIRTTS